MGQSPFAKRPASQETAAAKRRSSRVDFVTPMIFIGRDVSGEAFREETETITVNLHGAKFQTRHEVLIGMQVGVENPRDGNVGKAICVWVGAPKPGEETHEIAIQLLTPGNIWGMENPPEDWKLAAQTGAHPRLGAAVPGSRKPPAAEASPASSGPISFDSQFAELEQRSAQLSESVLQILREQADEIVARVLREFEGRLKEFEAASQSRLSERAEKAAADLEASVESLRQEFAERLMARSEQVVESAEEALREKVSEIFSSALKPPAVELPAEKPGPASKK